MHQRTDGVHSIRITVQDECSEKKSPLARWNVVRIASNDVPLIVSKTDVKATGQPRLPDPKESVWLSIRMCSEGPRRRTMLLPVTGKMRLQIQPQIHQSLIHYQNNAFPLRFNAYSLRSWILVRFLSCLSLPQTTSEASMCRSVAEAHSFNIACIVFK